MAATDFNTLFQTLMDGMADIARDTIKRSVKEATKEGRTALTVLKGDLERWTQMVADGELSIEDMEFLLAGRKELAEMTALSRLGIARIELDKFKDGIISLVVNTVGKVI